MANTISVKSKQYFISTKNGKIKVKGYPVVIPGYEEFNFFIHHLYIHSNFFNKRRWCISEEITGLNFSPLSYPSSMSNYTRAGALAIVIDYFKSMEYEQLLTVIRTFIERAR